MAVLITGGSGYIGSHTAVQLLQSGQEAVIIDNLSNSKESVLRNIKRIAGRDVKFYCGDVCNGELLKKIFEENPIDSVIHFAGLKAVGESVEKPLVYYQNNILSALTLLNAMEQNDCRNFVFSSSATVYQDAATLFPERMGTGIIGGEAISEDFPLSATNPYGMTKLMIEQILRDVYKADNRWNIVILRYFNPVGAHESYLIGEDAKGEPNNLLPYVAEVAKGSKPYLKIFGNDYLTKDGTGVRDYIHVSDLAEGHVKALEYIKTGCGLDTFNLGTGTGYSVLEIVKIFEQVTGQKVPCKVVERRPGDIASCYANPSKAEKVLYWKARRSLEDMCKSAWEWGKRL